MLHTRSVFALAATLCMTAGVAFAQSALPEMKTSVADGQKAVATYFTEDSIGDAQLGRLGLQKSKDASVRRLASAMVRDHTRTAREGMQVAQQIGASDVQWKPDASTQIDLTALSRYSGAEFDREYVKALIQAHQVDISTVKESQELVTSSALKAYLQNVLAVDQRHLQMAQAAQSQI
jgi:putative membrane protein